MKLLEEYIGFKLPPGYLAFLKQVKIRYPEGLINDCICIYLSEEDIIERNETFEMKEYLPGYLGIGNDSGGSEIIISLIEEKSKIYLANHGAYFEETMYVIAEDFIDFDNSNFSLETLQPKIARVENEEKLEIGRKREEMAKLRKQLTLLSKRKENGLLSLKRYLLEKRTIEKMIEQVQNSI